MIVVPLHRRHPLPGEALGRAGVEFVRRRHLARHQQAHFVGPIKIARVLHLLVLARAVEAHGLGRLDIGLDGLVRRRRQYALRPVALIEDHLQKNLTAVDRDAVAVDADGAESKIGLHGIHHLAAIQQFESRVVQVRVFRRP